MTAEEWLTSDNSEAMVRQVLPLATERKLRLLCCACARLVWDLLPEGLLRQAVESGEKHADGLISNEERQSFIPKLYSPWSKSERTPTWFGGPPWGEQSRDEWSAFMVAKLTVSPFPAPLGKMPPTLSWTEAIRLLGPTFPGLIRDVFPPSPEVAGSFHPAWRTPDAVTLAGHVYHDRAFASLPELADLLGDAGCVDQVILGHLRGAGPHTRGCWPVDLVLGLS